MKIFESQIKVYCLDDINKKDVYTQLSKLIDSCLMSSPVTSKIHQEQKYKFYNFGALQPFEKDGTYKKGNIYSFVLRTADESLAKYFRETLESQYTKVLKVLTVNTKQIKPIPLDKIYTLTPLIMKFDTGYWRGNYSVDVFEKRLKDNLIKKFNEYSQAKIDEDFELFSYISFDNIKPIGFSYKDITLLGDKITLGIATNEVAQQLAYLAIGSGLGEMNARGAGFVGYKYL